MLILGVVNGLPPVKTYIQFQDALGRAQKGEVYYQRYVGSMYAGSGMVHQDNREAYFWHSLAANGWGLEYDANQREEAAKRLTQEEIATVNKRIASWHPTKVERDIVAEGWVADAEKGDVQKQMGLAGYYNSRQGLSGIPQYKEAAKWYRRAAEKGEKEAQAALANFYENRRGVDEDIPEAAYWKLLSWPNEPSGADKRLIRRLTPEQVVAVSKRLSDNSAGDASLEKALSATYYHDDVELPGDLTVQKLCEACAEACEPKKAVE
jgi:hypothetical protein